MDWIPGISQLKSLVQTLSGDYEGACETQSNFVKQCPLVSQTTSLIQAFSGDEKAAQETQTEFLKTMSGVIDGVPIVGHVKGAIHYALGDSDGGDNAMRTASRSIGVISGGVGGFFVAGPVGAVAGGITGGSLVDGLTTAIDSAIHEEYRPSGHIANISEIAAEIEEGKNVAGKMFDLVGGVVLDGLTGKATGFRVKHVLAKPKAPISALNIKSAHGKVFNNGSSDDSSDNNVARTENIANSNEVEDDVYDLSWLFPDDIFDIAENRENKCETPEEDYVDMDVVDNDLENNDIEVILADVDKVDENKLDDISSVYSSFVGTVSQENVPEILEIDPDNVRFSQDYVNFINGQANTIFNLIDQMTQHGWSRDPIDIVRMPDGHLTSLSNKEVFAAKLTRTLIKAIVHHHSEKLPNDFSYQNSIDKTWGDAVQSRIFNETSLLFRNVHTNGSFSLPNIRINDAQKPAITDIENGDFCLIESEKENEFLIKLK